MASVLSQGQNRLIKPGRWAWSPAQIANPNLARGLVSLVPFWGPYQYGTSPRTNVTEYDLIARQTYAATDVGARLEGVGPTRGFFDQSTSDLVMSNAHPALAGLVKPYTVFVYYYENGTGPTYFRTLFFRGNSSGDDIEIYLSNTTKVVQLVHNRTNGGSFGAAASTGSVSVTQGMRAVAVTYTGTQARFYIGGNLDSTPSLTTDPLTSRTDVRWGKAAHTAFGTNGRLIACSLSLSAIWSRALSDGEIRRLSADPFALIRPRDVIVIPSAAGGATVTPATIAATVTVPTPTISIGATVTPATIAVTTTLPQATVTAGALVAPAVTPLTVTVPTPTIVVVSGATVTPAAIACVVALPGAAILAAATVTPTGFQLSVLVHKPGTSGGTVDIYARVAGLMVRILTPEPRLALVPIATVKLRGWKAADGWERASSKFIYNNGTHETVMESVASAWAANASAPIATLKAAINADLQAAGYRGPGGAAL